jgi:hypothetical protein
MQPPSAVAPVPSGMVLLGPGASETELFAAAEMALLGGNITNGHNPLPIRNMFTETLQSPDPSSLTIVVGHAAALLAGVPAAALDKLGRDGLRITVPSANNKLPPRTVSLSGGPGAPRGAMHAVYEFLEFQGLQFLAWDATVMPAGAPNATLTMPDTDIVQLPTSEYRSLVEWPVFSNRLHTRRMRLNPDSHDECVQVSGNAFCKPPHNWDSFRFAMLQPSFLQVSLLMDGTHGVSQVRNATRHGPHSLPAAMHQRDAHQ